MAPKLIPAKQAGVKPPQRKAAKQTPAAAFAFSWRTAFLAFAAANTLGALLSPIQDCDETFNYWEPAHYLLYGYGRQTWEYSPEFAIRDWVYVALHAAVAKVGGLVLRPLALVPGLAAAHEVALGGKVAEFYALRVALGLACAACQARFVGAVATALNPRVAIFTLVVMVASTGFFHAAPAFLPSSFAMCLGMLGASAFIDWKTAPGWSALNAFVAGSNAGIMWFGLGAVLGWPFAGALVLPFLVEELVVTIIADDLIELVRRWLDGSVRVFVFVIFQVAVNAFFYHRPLVIPFNIVFYNLFGGEGRGPDIYGTEPADYYIKNLALNFNVWLPLALLSAPLLIFHWLFGPQTQTKYILMRSMFFVTPFYMWLAIFSAQAHKEERFMYPAYPFLALNAAISFHTLLSFIGNADPKTVMGKIPAQLKLLVVGAALLIAVDVGLFRTVGLFTAYRAPMTIYGELYEPETINPWHTVCYGKEWYRFPSSFFMPDGMHGKFVRSEFNGLLPGEFSEAKVGFGFYPGTWLIPSGMNDQNIFDPGKVTNVHHCTYMVDSYTPGNPGSELEPNYVNSPDWEIMQCSDFLDVANTHPLARLLWVPDLAFVPDQFRRRWSQFCLLKRPKREGDA